MFLQIQFSPEVESIRYSIAYIALFLVIFAGLIIFCTNFVVKLLATKTKKNLLDPNRKTTKRDISKIAQILNLTTEEKNFLWKLCQENSVKNLCVELKDENFVDSIFKKEYSLIKNDENLTSLLFSVRNKIEFQKNYKFCLCAENTYAPGYTTEKILEAFASNCIPIYYGDPLAVLDFNPKAFINAHDFDNMDALLQRVKEIDTNDELYWQILQEPLFLPNTLEKYSDQKIYEFFDNIFSQPLNKAKRRFYFKPYQDFDYRNLKVRDIKLILKYFFLSRFKRKKH